MDKDVSNVGISFRRADRFVRSVMNATTRLLNRGKQPFAGVVIKA